MVIYGMKTRPWKNSGSSVCGKGRHYSGFTVVISFNHREELDTAVQFPNFRSLRWHTAHGACYIIVQCYLSISMGLRQRKERVKFGHRCSSEKATRCL